MKESEDTNNIDNDLAEMEKLAESLDIEIEMAEIAERSVVELKQDEFMPIFDEYYGSKVVDSFEVIDQNEYIEKSARKPLKDPKGGLTAAGRAYFKRKEGANLKPGVRGPANTPEKMRRKGSFLTRFFTNPSGPMKDEKGRATRLALSAAAWGEPVPKNAEDAAKLAEKGRRLLERYAKAKKKSLLEEDIAYKSVITGMDEDIRGLVGMYISEIDSNSNEYESFRRTFISEIFAEKTAQSKMMRNSDSRISMAKKTKIMRGKLAKPQEEAQGEEDKSRTIGKNKKREEDQTPIDI